MIVLALALYCLRLLGYSFINSPMESLFFEVSHLELDVNVLKSRFENYQDQVSIVLPFIC